MKINLPEYPVDHQGNLLGYAWSASRMATNVVFEATMRVEKATRGRSSVKFVLVDTTTQKHWPMFVMDAVEMMKTRNIINGETTGTWCVMKRGQNYGLRAVPADTKVAAS